MAAHPVIDTPQTLADWLDGHPARHARNPGDHCSCGWTNPGDVPQQRHADAMLITDLGDVLSSGTTGYSAGRQVPVSWSTLVSRLYDSIDQRDNETDPQLAILIHACITHWGHSALDVANAIVMHPDMVQRVNEERTSVTSRHTDQT